ncbi:MAG: spore coat protein CotJB [Oscillospiraceae bacterium]|nr:spore coat protein CotJB [Oscillospiraceae bacterium]
MADKTQLLNEIYDTSFAINDLTLYLDTHPDDARALAEFHQLKRRRKTAMSSFEQEFYPLTVDCASDRENRWTWGDTPAPWKGEMTNVEL